MTPCAYAAMFEQLRENKRRYFLEKLAPYIQDGILDTKQLNKSNHRLYEDVRMSYRGIIRACEELGLYRSKAAKDRAEGTVPRRKAYREVAT